MSTVSSLPSPVIEGSEAAIPAEELAKIRNRLSRAQGQLGAVIRMIDERKPCQEILTQMLASSKAVDRAAFSMMLAGLQACQVADEESEDARDVLERLFMSLA